VSLLRRARDIAIGIPILLVWQAVEVRHLRRSRRAASPI
jgi:glycosyltransferase 2 family protein